MPKININGKDLEVSSEVAKELDAFVKSVNQKVKNKEELIAIGDSFDIDTKDFKTAKEAKIKVLEMNGLKVGDDATEEFLNGALTALEQTKTKTAGNKISDFSKNYDNLIDDIFKEAK